LAQSLGVDGHIRWINAFVETGELLDFIEAADIFITPYPGAAQSTSGTLSYALALGKAVVSTPYLHAAELLADDHGIIVPFNDSSAIAAEIIALLDAPDRLLALQKRAYAKGRDMIWPEFAARSYDVIRDTLVNVPASVGHAAIGISGLLRICDDTGILQHSIFAVPDRAHGYCVDDNARALMLMNRLGAQAEPHRSQLAMNFAAFVQSAWNPARGEFRNFMSYRREWLEEIGSQDSCGRTLWALGATIKESDNPALRHWARGLFDESGASALGFGSPRATAFAMLGADYLLATNASHDLANLILAEGAERLLTLFRAARTRDWPWFETRLAYDNARLCEAMIRAGIRLARIDFIDCGITTLGWLMAIQTSHAGHFRPIGSDNFGHDFEPNQPFDQQPVEIWAAIDAASAAYSATGKAHWLDHAVRAYNWFDGKNDRGLAVGNPISGSCHDGLNPRGLNLNEGAESVLSYQLATCSLHTLING
jgi:Glycosyl transferases group 1